LPSHFEFIEANFKLIQWFNQQKLKILCYVDHVNYPIVFEASTCQSIEIMVLAFLNWRMKL